MVRLCPWSGCGFNHRRHHLDLELAQSPPHVGDTSPYWSLRWAGIRTRTSPFTRRSVVQPSLQQSAPGSRYSVPCLSAIVACHRLRQLSDASEPPCPQWCNTGCMVVTKPEIDWSGRCDRLLSARASKHAYNDPSTLELSPSLAYSVDRHPHGPQEVFSSLHKAGPVHHLVCNVGVGESLVLAALGRVSRCFVLTSTGVHLLSLAARWLASPEYPD